MQHPGAHTCSILGGSISTGICWLPYKWQNAHGLCMGWREPAAPMTYSYHASQQAVQHSHNAPCWSLSSKYFPPKSKEC